MILLVFYKKSYWCEDLSSRQLTIHYCHLPNTFGPRSHFITQSYIHFRTILKCFKSNLSKHKYMYHHIIYEKNFSLEKWSP